jgi:nitroreductase
LEFAEVIRRRRMVRSFADRAVPRAILDRVLDAGVKAPSAGFTQGTAFVVLEGDEQTATFWTITARSPEPPPAGGRYARMRTAPVIILSMSNKAAYLARYSEPDKVQLGMVDEAGWPMPFWDVDAAFASMAMLLAATDEGLGALFFAVTHGGAELLNDLGVPTGHRLIGAIALGWPAEADPPSPSLARGRKPREAVVHYGKWTPDLPKHRDSGQNNQV